MVVSDLIGVVDGVVVAGEGSLGKDVKGCFVGDLLSLAMGKAKKDDVWITVQTNINVIAVCTLCEVSAVVIAEGMKANEQMLEKANEEGIVIIESGKSAFDLALLVGKSL